VGLLATFLYFTYFLLCCATLILSCTQEHFCLAKCVSSEAANIAFDIAVQKVIKDIIKLDCLVSTALYYTEVLYHSLYLMNIFYCLTTIVVLLAGDEAIDKAKSNVTHIPDQGAAPSREGCLAGQRSGGLRHDVRVVVVPGVQSHLRTKLAEPTEKGIDAPLWGRRSRPQDPEAGMIQSFCLLVSVSY
jgi:hypothetical protein